MWLINHPAKFNTKTIWRTWPEHEHTQTQMSTPLANSNVNAPLTQRVPSAFQKFPWGIQMKAQMKAHSEEFATLHNNKWVMKRKGERERQRASEISEQARRGAIKRVSVRARARECEKEWSSGRASVRGRAGVQKSARICESRFLGELETEFKLDPFKNVSLGSHHPAKVKISALRHLATRLSGWEARCLKHAPCEPWVVGFS